MLGGADNLNGKLSSYITGSDTPIKASNWQVIANNMTCK